MAEEAPDTKKPAASEGVFGNLPGTRPGTRSPRREGGADSRRAAPAPVEPAGSRKPEPPPPPPPPAEPPAGAEREAPIAPAATPEPRIKGLEDLAWAGVAVAAQAATVGVRFASRALDAARKSADRT